MRRIDFFRGVKRLMTMDSASLKAEIPSSEVANGDARKQRLKRRQDERVKEACSIAP
jgi:hypothetical protein